ncbi:glutaredoxin domain-containing protein [Hahella ganghwensis]|uniref:glutaredoxin domain-containing protein n=1 Tax=Hahella ganghwensis TaxID=286420 RepID=UPI000361D76F|nr:glutaredoxin domain-containing protein [Hahella ganghwensis]
MWLVKTRYAVCRLLLLSGLMLCSSLSLAVERVVMFSQTYCAACVVAKSYLDANGIPYSEFLIDKSQAAREYFTKLGGKGTPFFVIDGRRMQGFQKQRFQELYGQTPDRR